MSAGEKHHMPLKVYYNILGALVVLTVITVAAAQVDFGHMNTIIALAIASVKATLVLGYFMHLKDDDKLYWVCFASAIFFLILLYFFSVLDIFTRIGQSNVL
ncbi:MAG: cytochrome C oxidase subunit IV family protein [Bdellovibrionales bacterium]